MNLCQLSIHEAHARLKSRQISAVELTRAVLDRIAAVEPRLGAFITVADDLAMRQAAQADIDIAAGRMTPLTGIPLAIKDLICTKDLRTTCASRFLEHFVPPYNATVIDKLRLAGAVIVGKTNMDEFAMGSSTEHSALQQTHNPWNLDFIPGGSSGGSAVAVAADMCLGALGSDTGGSIRQPASHCSVVGLKPTYGRVSRYGLIAFASSLDQIGPMAGNVTDAALLLETLAGYDAADSTAIPADVPTYSQLLHGDIKGLRVGIPAEYASIEGLDADVSRAIEAAVKQFEASGAHCMEVSIPHTRHAVAAYYLIAPAEASSNLARYDGVKYGFRDGDSQDLLEMYRRTRSQGFGQEVQRRILLGTYSLSAGYYDAYYGKACQIRTLIMEDFKRAFEVCDVILSPVTPTPAFPIGENIDDPLTMYLSDVFTLSANLSGIPALSVPCGFSSRGMPIGLQISGPHLSEVKLLNVGYYYEQLNNLHQLKPNL